MNAQWLGWPKHIPRPTESEYAEAEKRYKKTLTEEDWSDWPSGLEFVMATYTIWCWAEFFDALKDFRHYEYTC